MDFAAADSAYTNEVAAKDFSSALQALIAPGPRFELVERQQLAAAAAELKLTALGRLSDDTAARMGKWTKADLLVLGRFGQDSVGKPALHIEILDLAHADVLIEGKVPLEAGKDAVPQSVTRPVATVAQELKLLLEQAAIVHEHASRQVSLALLSFYRPADRMREAFLDAGLARTLAAFGDSLTAALTNAAATNDRIRLIRFPRANRSLEEAELVLSGLVESDPDAWQKLTDYYMWAEVTVTNLSGGPSLGSTQKKAVSVTLYRWDGRSDPTIFREGPRELDSGGWPEAEVSALCQRLARAALPESKPAIGPTRNDAIRAKISQILLQRADKIAGPVFHPWPDSPEVRRQISELFQALEMACFFDPQNRVAREKLVTGRWGWVIGQYAKDPFRFACRASEAWGGYVERFGLGPPADTNNPHIMASGGVAGGYVNSARAVIRLFLSWNTVPEDMPENVLEEWHGQLAAEFVQRVVTVADRVEVFHSWPLILRDGLDAGARQLVPDPKLRLKLIRAAWPRYVEYVKRTGRSQELADIKKGIIQTCGELRDARLADKFFSALGNATLPAPAPVATAAAAPPALEPKLVDLPKFYLPSLRVLPPEFKVALEKIALPPGNSANPFHNTMPVLSLVPFQGKLWIAVTVEETTPTPGINPDLEKEITPSRPLLGRLWAYDPLSKRLHPVAGEVSRFNVSALCVAGGYLWLAGEGVARLDVSTAQLKRFGVAEGLKVLDASAITKAGDSLFVAGGFQLSTLKLNGQTWSAVGLPNATWEFSGDHPITICGSERELLYSAGTLAVLDVAGATWRISPGPGRGDCADSDEEGFWLGERGRLTFVDAKFGTVRRSWQTSLYPSWRAPNEFLTIAMTGPQNVGGPNSDANAQTREDRILRAFEKFRQERLLAHGARQQQHRFKDEMKLSSRLPQEITAITSDHDFLWLGCKDWWGSTVVLVHKPTFSWVGHLKVPGTVSRLAVSEDRLWIGLLYGDDRLFEVDKRQLLSRPRSLWLGNEATQPELAAAIDALPTHTQALYSFFAGDYARAATLLEKEKLSTAGLETLFLLAYCYDDLGLDKPELARRYFEEVSTRFPNSSWSKAASEQLAASARTRQEGERERALFTKYDRNHDGVLDQTERAAMEKDPDYQRQHKELTLERELEVIITKYDQDGDRILRKPELERLVEGVKVYSQAPPEILAGRQIVLRPLLSKHFPTAEKLLTKYDTARIGGLGLSELKRLAQDLENGK